MGTKENLNAVGSHPSRRSRRVLTVKSKAAVIPCMGLLLCHIYACTTVPADALNDWSPLVTATIVDQPASITVR